MTDHELLELAAKAAGYDFVLYIGYDEENDEYKTHPWLREPKRLFGWNPLTDDGDALRLAVKLKISIEYTNSGVYAGPDADNEDWYHEFFNKDPYASTRRAIVRAAAEIGKDLK